MSTTPIQASEASTPGFLSDKDIPIGSWWEIAQGGEYGYCVTAVDAEIHEATVLSTSGEVRTIDTFKLQYAYRRVLPNNHRPQNQVAG